MSYTIIIMVFLHGHVDLFEWPAKPFINLEECERAVNTQVYPEIKTMFKKGERIQIVCAKENEQMASR